MQKLNHGRGRRRKGLEWSEDSKSTLEEKGVYGKPRMVETEGWREML
jgi:hypothetical protein